MAMDGTATPQLSPNHPGWRAWCRDYYLLLVGLGFLIGIGFVFARQTERSEWSLCFLTAARQMREGTAIHNPGLTTYSYPPLMALLAVPFSDLSIRNSHLAWFAVNAVALLAMFLWCWRLAGAPGWIALDWKWTGIFWLGILLAGRYILAPLQHQQFDVVITAVLAGGVLLIWRGHDWLGGCSLGAAAAMKCTPLLFAPYLVWRGKYVAAGLLLAVSVLLNVVPDLVSPQLDGDSYLRDWKNTYLNFAGNSAPGVWHSDLTLNQSLGGSLNRLMRLGLGLPVKEAHLAGRELPAWAADNLKGLTYGTGLLLLGICLLRFGRPFRGAPLVETARPVDWQQMRTPVEASAIFCLMLLLSPMSSKAHYIVLLLPCWLVVRYLVETHAGWSGILFGVLVVTGPLTTKGIVGKSVGDATLAWGLPTAFVMALLVGMWLLPVGERRKDEG